jgi:FlaA1/EpsC-like NDP-sugar epimerase
MTTQVMREGIRRPTVEQALGRAEWQDDLAEPVERLRTRRLLVTGAAGSIGSSVTSALQHTGVTACPTDLLDLDITDPDQVDAIFKERRPDLVVHCAGRKWAEDGEQAPQAVTEVNANGTANLIRALPATARLVTVSTCKACNPETVYGATKLIAERMTLNASGSVARLYNVVESCGNVFEHWAALPTDAPVPVTPCSRYFMSIREAVALVLWAAVLPPGRYISDPGAPRQMADLAADLYPGQPLVPIAPRRGDRIAEPRIAHNEFAHPVRGPIERVTSRHDA